MKIFTYLFIGLNSYSAILFLLRFAGITAHQQAYVDDWILCAGFFVTAVTPILLLRYTAKIRLALLISSIPWVVLACIIAVALYLVVSGRSKLY